MRAKERKALLAELEARGFDRSKASGAAVRVGCSLCQAACINGIACHERGCPNQSHECAECCAMIPLHRRICDSCGEGA